jgi:hypothetical protein
MAAVDSCICPHCETRIARADLLDSMVVRAVGSVEHLHLLICTQCNKPLGTFSTP